MAALEAARATDEDHKAALDALAEDELGSSKAARIERRLRDKVRQALDLPLLTGSNLAGLTDYARSLGIDPSFDLAPAPYKPKQTAPSGPIEFQALLLPEPLERHLSKIRDTARTVAEESGVSTLHLAFGFLEWFESDDSDRPITSPLLLMRVDIDRKIVRSRYQYVLVGVGDEAEANLTLSERLTRDFRVQLPDFGEDEAAEAYLTRVQEEVCKGRKRWIVRRYVTLAHFPFARLAMFQDLDEALWAQSGGLAGHPLLGSLLGGTDSGLSLFAEEHEIDSPEVTAKVPPLVMEADASQHSAVYDVMDGKNLVIEGPPGTGKSQTITNIVAAALASGKRVLFMADKQAALQVVKDRLDKVGLGDFCLELHSGKARKKDVLDALEQRLSRRPMATGIRVGCRANLASPGLLVSDLIPKLKIKSVTSTLNSIPKRKKSVTGLRGDGTLARRHQVVAPSGSVLSDPSGRNVPSPPAEAGVRDVEITSAANLSKKRSTKPL